MKAPREDEIDDAEVVDEYCNCVEVDHRGRLYRWLAANEPGAGKVQESCVRGSLSSRTERAHWLDHARRAAGFDDYPTGA